MGVLIYVDGGLHTDAKGEILHRILDIQNGWGENAFYFSAESSGKYKLVFAEQMEGLDPINCGVKKPLDELCELSKKDGFHVEGDIIIMSDCDSCDDIGYEVKDDRYTVYNTVIRNAETQELVNELKRRGFSVSAEIEKEKRRKNDNE